MSEFDIWRMDVYMLYVYLYDIVSDMIDKLNEKTWMQHIKREEKAKKKTEKEEKKRKKRKNQSLNCQ